MSDHAEAQVSHRACLVTQQVRATIDDHEVETHIAARFEDQIARFGDRLAVHSDGRELNYNELNAGANCLAHTLLDRFGGEGQPVGLLVDQGVALATGIMGTLKAGRAFVSLEPSYPEARLAFMLEDSQAEVIVTQSRHLAFAQQLAGDRAAILVLDDDTLVSNDTNPGRTVDPGHTAYILYTSGSTGQPKGVVQDHRSVLHNMLRHRIAFDYNEHSRQTQLYPTSVYGGTRDLFNSLLNGAAMFHYPLREAGHAGLKQWIEHHELTHYCSVATVFRHFARELQGSQLFPSLRYIKLGGEAPYRGDIDLFKEHFCRGAVMMCGLGSTETGMSRAFAITHDTQTEGAAVPLGYAVPGMDVQLLDDDSKPVGVDEVGEIVIRSRYIMRGYRGRDELNAKVLGADPDDQSVRIFRTGDLGQIDREGCLVHKGRKDRQVKVRGNRVELTEVESALAGCAGVREAVTTAHKTPENDTQLVAYIVAEDDATVTVHAIRNDLKNRLPHFAVPSVYISIDVIPQTPNGKIDRAQLPDPMADTTRRLEAGGEIVAPTNELEKQLLPIWQKILKMDEIGIDDSFFDLGGDSMSAVRLLLSIEKELDKSLPLTGFNTHPTIRTMALWIERGGDVEGHHGVVVFNETGEKTPMFCLPGRGGTVFCYRGVAERIGRDRPVYGLPLPGLDGGNDTPIEGVENLAAEMIRRATQVCPQGPVLLIGYSFGGLVAYEMARQWREQGREVKYVGLLDTASPQPKRKLPVSQRLKKHFKQFCELDAAGKFDYLTKRVSRVFGRVKSKSQPANLFSEPPMPDGDGKVTHALQQVREAAKLSRLRYKPESYGGAVCLFRSDVLPDWAEFIQIDPTYGWDRLARGGVKTYEVPGPHEEIFDTAHQTVLSEQVQASLDDSGV